jgi:type IV secretory pathway VirB2 component (pilin)
VIQNILTFLAENVAFFGIAVAGVVALVGLLLLFGHLASKTESTCDNSIVLRILDAFTFWIPVVGPRITKQIFTKPSQGKKL